MLACPEVLPLHLIHGGIVRENADLRVAVEGRDVELGLVLLPQVDPPVERPVLVLVVDLVDELCARTVVLHHLVRPLVLL